MAANLDGDTDQDLAITDGNNGRVTILKNAGKGNFSQPATSPEVVGASPSSIAAADLDAIPTSTSRSRRRATTRTT